MEVSRLVWATDLKQKDWIEQPIVCTRHNLKPGFSDRRHLGETILRATALDLRSKDYKSKKKKKNKPSVENPCCYPNHRCLIDTFTNWGLTTKWSHQDGRRKFIRFKHGTTEAGSSLFLIFGQWSKLKIRVCNVWVSLGVLGLFLRLRLGHRSSFCGL